jgi:hypothetical protein
LAKLCFKIFKEISIVWFVPEYIYHHWITFNNDILLWVTKIFLLITFKVWWIFIYCRHRHFSSSCNLFLKKMLDFLHYPKLRYDQPYALPPLWGVFKSNWTPFNLIECDGRGFITQRRSHFSFFFFFSLIIIFLSLGSLLERKIEFHFNYIIIYGMCLLNYAKFIIKYGTWYFQSPIKKTWW